MLEFVHATAGGIIAYKIGSPLLSLPLAFLSHFLLDLLPHWNPSLTKEKKNKGRISFKTMIIILIDCLIGLFFGLKIALMALPDLGKAFIVVLGCFVAILPDLVEATYYFLNRNIPFLRNLVKFQNSHQWNINIFTGICSQIILLVLLFAFLNS
jgi:hypothetical protein